MSKTILVLDKIKVLKKRKKWNLYLILVINHPSDSTKKLVRIIPEGHFIDLKKQTDDSYSFVPLGGESGDGLELLSTSSRQERLMNIQVYVKNHEGIKNIISVTKNIEGDLNIGYEAVGKWLTVGLKALNSLESIINKIPDRNMGMLNIGFIFSKAERAHTFSNKTTTGEIELTWTWIFDR